MELKCGLGAKGIMLLFIDMRKWNCNTNIDLELN